MKRTNGEEEGGRDGYQIHRFYIELMLPLAGLERQRQLRLASLLTRQCFKVSRREVERAGGNEVLMLIITKTARASRNGTVGACLK